MKISVIIPTYNRSAILKGLLTMLTTDTVSQQAVEYEVIVADDQSKDDTWEMLGRGFPQVRRVKGPGKNAEFAKRAAIEVATGDYIVNLDDDSMPRTGWLAKVLPALLRGEKIVQVKTVFLDMDQEDLQNETDKRVFRTGFRFDMMPVATLNGGYRPQYINNCHEFGCFVHREVLASVPLDDPNLIFNHLGESASFFLRAKAAGYRVFFEPSCVIDHLGAMAGGCLDRSEKQKPKKNCTDFTTGMVHNFMILARMYQPSRIPLLIPYYLAGGAYLSIRQRKNCMKFFVRGLYRGLTKQFVPMIPYQNIRSGA